jgi:hypothetical protein
VALRAEVSHFKPALNKSTRLKKLQHRAYQRNSQSV